MLIDRPEYRKRVLEACRAYARNRAESRKAKTHELASGWTNGRTLDLDGRQGLLFTAHGTRDTSHDTKRLEVSTLWDIDQRAVITAKTRQS